jgi:hypothetical protein
LEIFDMIVSTNEVAKELVNMESNFQVVSSWCQKHQMSSSMVGKTWNYVFYNWIPCPSNIGDYWITNWILKKL